MNRYLPWALAGAAVGAFALCAWGRPTRLGGGGGATHRIFSRIYEPDGVGDAYPVVDHIFNGRSFKEAQGYYNAHLKSDAFFSGCVEKQCFDSSVKCIEQHRYEVRDGDRWSHVVA